MASLLVCPVPVIPVVIMPSDDDVTGGGGGGSVRPVVIMPANVEVESTSVKTAIVPSCFRFFIVFS